MAKSDLTAQRLRELLHYDPETGVFTRRVRTANAIRAGDVTGCRNTIGYLVISVLNRRYLAHRLAWLYAHGEWPVADIDHINGVRQDNRIANLRDVSRSANIQNQRRPQTHGTSGFLGVTWSKQIKRWVAAITVPTNRRKHIGCFATAEEASAAYLEAKRKLHTGCTI